MMTRVQVSHRPQDEEVGGRSVHHGCSERPLPLCTPALGPQPARGPALRVPGREDS